jgi:CubicO group peptidase (beta-lactamase class C family)
MSISVAGKQAPSDLTTQPCSIAEDVKESIRFRVDHGYNVGIMAGIIGPEGTEYYSYGSTAHDVNQLPNENTVFEIGSCTKVFTALLLSDMVERGEVTFEDPIEKYLPKTLQVPQYNDKSITLVNLATHTSGLPRVPHNMNLTSLDNPYASYSVEQMYGFLEEYILQRDIGETVEYSNYGMGLLGHILEMRGKMTYEQLIKERIANQLGMSDTGITLAHELKSRLAKGYRAGAETPNWDFLALAGAGALRSTARDMLTFLAANMGLKKSRLYSAMTTTHEHRHDTSSPITNIGLGWHILTIDEHQLICHAGGTGGYYCFAGFSKTQQRGVVVLTNTSQTVEDIGFHLLDANIPLSQLDPNFPLHRAELLAESVNIDLAPGEELPTGRKIMQRYIECIGGHDALAKIHNRVLRLRSEIKSLGMKSTIVIRQARPNKYYAKMDISALMTIEKGTNGQFVWELSSMSGGRIIKEEERAAMLLHYRFDDMNYEQLYKKIECVGMEEIEHEACYKLVFTPKEAAAFVAYFSKVSGLMVKTVISIPGQSGQIKVQRFMSDYSKVDGILYPHQFVETAMNMVSYDTVESLKHNVEMLKNQFELPVKIKNLIEDSKGK